MPQWRDLSFRKKRLYVHGSFIYFRYTLNIVSGVDNRIAEYYTEITIAFSIGEYC